MRNFNWETLPKHTVVGKHNIWTADQADGDYELDTDRMEELFSNKQKLGAVKRQSLRGLPAVASGGEMITILNSKRSMNIGIFLKQFKRPIKDMIEDIKSGNGLSFALGKLRELCKLLPEDGEIKDLVGFKGDPSALPEADLFMLMLVQIPIYVERLNSLVLREEFSPLMGDLKGQISTLTAAGQELLECDHLHSVIRLVLKTGNHMNAGGYAGSAIGFRMASLLKLADTKANKPGMNLMHYVVMQSQNVDTALLKFPEQLKHIEAASRINRGEIEAEFQRQVKKLEVAKEDTLKQEDLKGQMENFLQEAEALLTEMDNKLKELQSVSDSVAEYFCEDPSEFKLDECCSIFHSFCERFLRAMQENRTREVAEVQRRHKDRLQCASKRRSTATCSSRDKEMEGVALESVLQNFLSGRGSRRRSGRPSSTQGSPAGGSPRNGSLTEITSQANLPTGGQKKGELIILKELTKKEWNSAVELTEKSSPKQRQASGEDEERKTSTQENSKVLPPPVNGAASPASSARPFSAHAAADGDGDQEDEVKDNSEEEAQKLREASRKVLRFQNSRGSVSSAEFSVENQSSPSAKTKLPRQRTFDEETSSFPDDAGGDDLVRLLMESEASSLSKLSRRHTLPIKVVKTEKEPDDPWAQPASTKERVTLAAAERSGSGSSRQVFDFNDVSHLLKTPADREQTSPSAEKKRKPTVSEARSSEEGPGARSPEGPSAEPTEEEKNSEDVPSKGAWFKTESPGLFSGLFKRLGDLSK